MPRSLFFITLLILSNCSFAASVNDEAKSIARQGSSAAESEIGSLSAEDQLGVSASGSLGDGGRNADVKYAQVLNGSFVCPEEAGEAGRYSKLQQFATVCETTTPTKKLLWVCVPNDPNDSMSTECEDGNWHSTQVVVGDDNWKQVTTGLKAKIESCTDTRCDYKVERSSDFSGGEAEATSDGEGALASASGTTETLKGQGASLPDGTVLQPGSNENSGTIMGEMVAAGSMAECADNVKASLDDGTPVFTCDGQRSVDTLTGAEDECQDIETCLETETDTVTSTKRCLASVNYEGVECRTDTPWKECVLSNARDEYSCDVDTKVTIRTVYSYKEHSPTCVSGTKTSSWVTNPDIPYNDARYHLMASAANSTVFSVGDVIAKDYRNGTHISSSCKQEGTSLDSYDYVGKVCWRKPGETATKLAFEKIQAPGTTYGSPYGTVYKTCTIGTPCKSGYQAQSGRCVKTGTSTSGFTYYTSKLRSNPPSSEPDAKWDYYLKKEKVSGCQTYEASQ